MRKKITQKDIVNMMVRLSMLAINIEQRAYFVRQFIETLKTISQLASLKTESVPETNQVTELTNIFREDRIEENRVLSHDQALFNAQNTHHGYFVVKAIL